MVMRKAKFDRELQHRMVMLMRRQVDGSISSPELDKGVKWFRDGDASGVYLETCDPTPQWFEHYRGSLLSLGGLGAPSKNSILERCTVMLRLSRLGVRT